MNTKTPPISAVEILCRLNGETMERARQIAESEIGLKLTVISEAPDHILYSVKNHPRIDTLMLEKFSGRRNVIKCLLTYL